MAKTHEAVKEHEHHVSHAHHSPAVEHSDEPTVNGPSVTPLAGPPGSASGFKILPGYPQSVGAKRESMALHYGPASYATVVTGTPPTGGDVLRAAEFGLKFFEFVESSASSDGQYAVEAVFTGYGPPSSVILLWTVAATGAQVTAAVNLSAVSVRLRAIGHGG